MAVFIGELNATFAKVGDLIMGQDEFEWFRQASKDCAEFQGVNQLGSVSKG